MIIKCKLLFNCKFFGRISWLQFQASLPWIYFFWISFEAILWPRGSEWCPEGCSEWWPIASLMKRRRTHSTRAESVFILKILLWKWLSYTVIHSLLYSVCTTVNKLLYGLRMCSQTRVGIRQIFSIKHSPSNPWIHNNLSNFTQTLRPSKGLQTFRFQP